MTQHAPAEPEGGTSVRPLRALLCVLAAVATAYLPLDLEPKAHGTLVLLVAMAGLWITEALPLGLTALLVPVIGTALGVTDVKSAFSGFGDPIVFMFLGTFLLTDAASQHGLDRRVADSVMTSRWVHASPKRLLWAIAFLGLVISAWVNNTATTAMLLPLALGARRLGSRPFLVCVLLMTSYAPSLGGLATPVGTAPNLIGLATLKKAGHEVQFVQWMVWFMPLAMIATAGTAWWLSKCAGRIEMKEMPDSTHEIRIGWTRAEKTIAWVFGLTILLWVTPGILKGTPLAAAAWLKAWSAQLPESCVPLVGGAVLFLLPSGRADRSRVADAGAFARIDWTTILLFGGGLALGNMLESSGLAKALGEHIFEVMPDDSLFGIVLAATLMAVLVSELTSNTASAALVVPIVVELAKAAHVDPVAPALAATVGCSFGFMLPVSTPPNALVFGTGHLRIADMVKYGILLDVAGTLLVAAWCTFVVA